MDNQYTLEEIIAEVKSGKLTQPSDPAASQKGEAVPRRVRPAPEEREASPVSERHSAPQRPDASERHSAPQREQKVQPGARTKVVDFPERLSAEEESWTPEKPRRRPRAPWRTEVPPEWEMPQEASDMEEDFPQEDDEEDELPPRPYDFASPEFEDAEQGAAYCASKTAALSARILFMVPLAAISVYMTLAAMLPLPMPPGFTYIERPFFYVLTLCAAQVFSMLLASDVTGPGLYRLLALRPTMDSAVLFSSLCTLAHAVSIIVLPQWGGYLPYSCISVLTCLLATAAKRQRADVRKRAYKICQLATAPTAVKRIRLGEKHFVAVKTQQGAYPEPGSVVSMSRAERVSLLYAPIVIVACPALAAAAAFGQGKGTMFLWALAALASVSVPIPLLFASTAPARRVAKKLFTSGAAILGSSGAARLSRCRFAVLRDGDLFPAGSVRITGMKLASNRRVEEVIGTAASVFAACGSGVGKAFADFAREKYLVIRPARDVQFFETGGLSATVDGHYVLAGSSSFLMRMGVRVTLGSKLADGLFLAIDSEFAGVFTVKYSVQPQAFSAFRVLRRCRLRPILATLHFGLTQAMVEKRFELRTDWVQYPELARRAELAAPECGRSGEPLAVLSRDSALAFCEAVGGARQQSRAERAGILIGLLSAVFGLGIMYFLVAAFETASATPYNTLLFLLLWEVPAFLSGWLITKF